LSPGAGPRVGLLFGGRSVEHEVSLLSARGVLEAMAGTGLTAVPLGVTREGRWLTPERSRQILAGSAPRAEAPEGDGGRVLLDPGAGRLLVAAGPAAPPAALELDALFPLVHGWGGEDGRLQGALDLCRIPCVGSGVLGSAAAMDKCVARRLFDAHGLPGVRWIEVQAAAYARAPAAWRARVAAEIGFPAFVKPANGGSSVGVSRVAAPAGLEGALEQAWACDGKALVEAAVVGAREIECAVLGNDEPETSVLGEIVPSGEFYDYAAKYLDGTSRLVIPAELPGAAAQSLRAHAAAAYRALGLRGLARVDFLVERATGRAFVNEVNTLPGFTPISMFPRLWAASGLAYPQLIERLVELALERFREEGAYRTAR